MEPSPRLGPQRLPKAPPLPLRLWRLVPPLLLPAEAPAPLLLRKSARPSTADVRASPPLKGVCMKREHTARQSEAAAR